MFVSDGGSAVVALDIGWFYWSIGLLIYAVRAWLLGRLFHKAGVGRWKAWLPFFNLWKFFNLGGRNGLWLLLGCVAGLSALLGYGVIGIFNIDNPGPLTPISLAAAAIGLLYLYGFISAAYNIQKKLGKSGPFLLLGLIQLIAPLWLWLLALDDSQWDDKKGRPALG
jgi:hypothetical protein